MNPGSKKKLGWWVGVTKDVGGPMTFWILPKSGIIVPRSSVTALTPEEMGTDGIKAMMKELDDGIRQKIRDQLKDDELLPGFEDLPGIADGPWDIEDEVFDLYEPEALAPEADEYEDLELFDKYIGAEINLNRGGQVLHGKVIGWKRNSAGNLVSRGANNPLLDTREYEVEFIDGSTEAYTANIVTEVMYSQVDEEGNSHVMLNEIIDHRKNKAAVSHDDAYVPSRSGHISQRRMTKGWEMNVLWKDGMSDWVSL